MKASCPHCRHEVSVRPFARLKDVSCPGCSRLVFREERVWGKIWLLFTVACALITGFILYRATENIMQMWSVYLIYLGPAAVILLLAPFGSPLMYCVHRAKEKKALR